MVTPAAKQELLRVSERRACSAGVDRTSVRYRSGRPSDAVYDCACANWRLSAAGSAIAACAS
jgi:hypothetical protein